MAEAPQIRREVIRIGLGTVITLWLGSKAAAGVWWLARHPSVWLAAGACWGLWWLDASAGVPAVVGLAAGAVAVVVVWRYAHPGSFRWLVARRARAWRRRVFVYRREWPLSPARLHDLRHVHATTLLLAGVPVHVVAERLGHADPSITPFGSTRTSSATMRPKSLTLRPRRRRWWGRSRRARSSAAVTAPC